MKEISGRRIANEMKKSLKEEFSLIPGEKIISLIYVGNDSVIENFIRYKKKFGENVGVLLQVHHITEESGTQELISQVKEIVTEGRSQAIVVQLPLPDHIDRDSVLNAVPKEMDIDLLAEETKEAFRKKLTPFFPPVVGAVLKSLESRNIPLRGKKICLLGYGKLVGKPMSLYLEREKIAFTLIRSKHSHEEMEKALRNADIVISGIGNPHSIKSSFLRDGVVLVDAGTSESGGKILGDIDPEAYEKASFYTPVPGGIGPLTIAVLYENFLKKLRGEFLC